MESNDQWNMEIADVRYGFERAQHWHKRIVELWEKQQTARDPLDTSKCDMAVERERSDQTEIMRVSNPLYTMIMNLWCWVNLPTLIAQHNWTPFVGEPLTPSGHEIYFCWPRFYKAKKTTGKSVGDPIEHSKSFLNTRPIHVISRTVLWMF